MEQQMARIALSCVLLMIDFVRGRGRLAGQNRTVVVADTIGLCDTFDHDQAVRLMKDRIAENMNRVHRVYIVVHKDRLLPKFQEALKEVLRWLQYNKSTNKKFFKFVITHTEGGAFFSFYICFVCLLVFFCASNV